MPERSSSKTVVSPQHDGDIVTDLFYHRPGASTLVHEQAVFFAIPYISRDVYSLAKV
jgi:hypothetical protein